MTDHAYRFGVEEEFFLADAETRATPGASVAAFHERVARGFERVEPELLQSQVEISSEPATDFAEARGQLGGLRAALAEAAGEHKLLVFGAGTHPLALWARQTASQGERYQRLMRELGMLGRRNVVCGMHVHVEVADPDARVGLMRRLVPFLPVLLGLSASSPFWQGAPTGLSAYRLSAFGELPRTGLPDAFGSEEEFARFVRVMVAAGAIKDSSFLWWLIRPSLKYPTLELRVADSGPRLDDALAIAALYRALVRCAERRPDVNANADAVSRAIAAENLWRAQARGTEAELIAENEERALPFAEALERVIALVGEDAEALGCVREVEATRDIVARGTSAARQLRVFEDAQAAGREGAAALTPVVDALARETAGGAA